MYIELYTYVDGDEACQQGEYIGYVSLEEDEVYIDVDDMSLEESLEDLFSEPLIVSNQYTGEEREIEPYTEEFFRQIIHILPDLNLRGKLVETEDPYVKRTIVAPEDLEDEEIERGDLDSIIDVSAEDIHDLEDDLADLEFSSGIEEEEYI